MFFVFVYSTRDRRGRGREGGSATLTPRMYPNHGFLLHASYTSPKFVAIDAKPQTMRSRKRSEAASHGATRAIDAKPQTMRSRKRSEAASC